ncbi:hypothetical protein M409DRAFT_23105 [Zasmidium cellare ATCC 36951]|uniref:RING-type domain-containing protein n=1 Tax=Zasmidium cellare ATCC 36951 TaxID=1080233 RepID=A0A6A6CLZ8_ZASCE|nr:uncharacterized protein M409DRAFT_23105 [Zasmidium cellare ATCC 36951]KAF2166466.1 hypothetical protein M409DRAFT_23105 [Zasmidium cellare ATCC 36951]
MPSNTVQPLPQKGDFILVGRDSITGLGCHNKLLLICEAPYNRRRAAPTNVRVVDVNTMAPYIPSARFLETNLGRRIAEADSAEDAVAIFRRAAEPEFYDPRNEHLFARAAPLTSHLGRQNMFFLRPSDEAVRKVLLGEVCPNEECQRGLLAASAREEIYRRYGLSHSALQEDRGDTPMACPACLPKDVVVENEKQILVARRLDSGGRVTNDELDALRLNERRLNERRLEAGYPKIRFCPDIVWLINGRRRSSWMARRPGRWREYMAALRTGDGVNNTLPMHDWWGVQEDDATVDEGTHHSPTHNLPRRSFAELKDSINNSSCSICLSESYTDSDEVVVLPCVHFFHEACIAAWLHQHQNCPECRRQVPAVD